MRMRSTGLGKSEMKGDLVKIEPSEDLLIMHIETTEPEGWKLRAAVQPKDIPIMIKMLLKPDIISYLIKSIFTRKKNPNEPEDF